MNLKLELGTLLLRASPGGAAASPLPAMVAVVDLCVGFALKAGCGQQFAAVLAAEAALMRAALEPAPANDASQAGGK